MTDKYEFQNPREERKWFANDMFAHFNNNRQEVRELGRKAIDNPRSLADLWVDMVLTVYKIYDRDIQFRHDSVASSNSNSRLSVSVENKPRVFNDKERRRELQEKGIVGLDRYGSRARWFTVEYLEHQPDRINKV